MEKINVAELLKDCPKGMELDCTMFEDVKFIDIVEANTPICIRAGGIHRFLTKFGTWTFDENAKCVIFPKGKTTWEGFQRPFKDGDILATELGSVFILKTDRNNDEHYGCYVGVACNNDYLDVNDIFAYKHLCRYANENEKQKLFKAIKANGYKWNAETKTLEKLTEPKFKVGDKIRHKTHIRQGNAVTEIKDTHYILDDELALPFTSQDDYELVPNKFDINTLVPFESKVLVRNDEHQYWIPAFWGCKRADDYTTTFGWCKYCIPFEGNEHLLETTNDCDEYYKTWK